MNSPDWEERGIILRWSHSVPCAHRLTIVSFNEEDFPTSHQSSQSSIIISLVNGSKGLTMLWSMSRRRCAPSSNSWGLMSSSLRPIMWCDYSRVFEYILSLSRISKWWKYIPLSSLFSNWFTHSSPWVKNISWTTISLLRSWSSLSHGRLCDDHFSLLYLPR